VKGHATTAIADALETALSAHARALVKRGTAAIDGPVDAVRRARVASRRLRETLGVVGDAGVRMGAGRIARAARGVTRALGPVREIDVAIEELVRGAKRHGWPADAVVRRRLDRERDRRRRPMLRTMKRADLRALAVRCDRIAKAIGDRVTERELWRAVARRVIRRTDGVTSAIASCGTLYVPERLHALRIAIKKLRYALEFVQGTRGVEVDEMIAALKQAQQRFGHLHDMQILLAEVEALSAGSRRQALSRDLHIMIEALDRDCRRIHARILPHLPALQAKVDALKRDLSARTHGRRLSMAKANLETRAARRQASR